LQQEEGKHVRKILTMGLAVARWMTVADGSLTTFSAPDKTRIRRVGKITRVYIYIYIRELEKSPLGSHIYVEIDQ